VAIVLLSVAAAGAAAYLALQPKASPPGTPASAEPPAPAPPPAPASRPAAAALAPASHGGPIRDLGRQVEAPSPAAPLGAPGARPDPQTVPFLGEMPGEFARSIPPLTVNIHVYAPDPAQRVLYINNRPVREGEAVADGIYVESIVADGVVLQRHGTRFKLPRPR
jgi:hypothetical protein